MDARQVGDGDFALALEDPVDVGAPGPRGHVPLRHVADAFGVFQGRRGHQSNVAERRAAEGCHYTAAARSRGAYGALDVIQVFLGNRSEFFQVVGRVELFFVDFRLPDDVVEEGAAQRHARARRRRLVALGIGQDIAVGLGSGLEIAGDQHLQTAEGPLFPIRGGSTELGLARKHAGDIEPHGRAQIVLHAAQHLARLMHLHRSRGQSVVTAERRDASDVDAGYVGAPKIQGNAVRLAMFQGGAQPVPRRDGGLAQVVWLNRRFIARVQHRARGRCIAERRRIGPIREATQLTDGPHRSALGSSSLRA